MPHSKPFIVIGSGGHANVVIDALQTIGHSILFCTDVDESRCGEKVCDVQVAGHDDLINDHLPADVYLANGLGSIGVPKLRKKVYAQWIEQGFEFPEIVHPAAFVSSTASLGSGAQIMAGAVVQTSARVNANSIVNTRATVDHDCLIGEHCHVAPGVTISGAVTTGELCHIGTGANIIQSIRIGNRVVIGSGATVIRDISDDLIVTGIPAKAR